MIPQNTTVWPVCTSLSVPATLKREASVHSWFQNSGQRGGEYELHTGSHFSDGLLSVVQKSVVVANCKFSTFENFLTL